MTLAARTVLAAALLAAAAAACDSGGPKNPSRIILILVDTLRADHVSAYGGSIPTPNIERLAERGQVFTNASASFHQTSMSMGALFTGRTPSLESGDVGSILPWNGRTWCGLARFSSGDAEDGCIPSGVDTLGAVAKRAGYITAGVVANHYLFRPAGFDRGFDDWVEVGPRPADPNNIELLPFASRRAEFVTRAALEILDRHATDQLFLYLHYMDVHDYTSDQNRRPVAVGYAAAVANFDESLGSLLDALEERNLLDDSLLILVSDHGETLGETHVLESLRSHLGNPSFEPVLRVPLIASQPIADDPTQFLRSEDLFGLIADIAGGASLEREEDLEADELYLSEFRYQTYRRGRWKTIRSRSDGETWLLDLEADPGEMRNVAGAEPKILESHAQRLRELAARLATSHRVPDVLSEDDRERLRALGYLE